MKDEKSGTCAMPRCRNRRDLSWKGMPVCMACFESHDREELQEILDRYLGEKSEAKEDVA